jgi:hypothetical protein
VVAVRSLKIYCQRADALALLTVYGWGCSLCGERLEWIVW